MPKQIERLLTFVEYFLVSACLLFTTFNIATYLYIRAQKMPQGKVLAAKSENSTLESINYWNSFLAHYPTYRDGYLEMAKAYLELGNKEEALKYLGLARILDPNNKKIDTLASEISLK